MSGEDLATELLCAAHDAGLERPIEITPAALRHSYLAFLARQGIRLGDLGRLVGRLTPEQAGVYSALAPEGTRRSASEVALVMDGVAHAAHGGGVDA